MTTRIISVAALAATLCVIPSFGTQGMGTLRQLGNHPDRMLVTAAATARQINALLARADGIAAQGIDAAAR